VKAEFDYPIVACFAEGELALREASRAGLISYIPGDNHFEIKKEENRIRIFGNYDHSFHIRKNELISNENKKKKRKMNQ
jgi:hypothetical protein